ncbi:MAG: PAC2 family protein [Candidatus Nezhaarchaeota archaeon]|nr:PAC2 family protein [Candidatus Nezhaarchaeota archaeon]
MKTTVALKAKFRDKRWRIFFAGFQGIGFVGYIAIKHLVTKLKAEPVGVIETSALPPFVWMENGRLISPLQLYGFNDLLFLVTETLPPIRDQYGLFRTIADWVTDSKLEEAILIGGLDQRFRVDASKARCAATEAYIRRGGLGLPLIERGLLITGPLALMLHRFEVRDFPALAILPYAIAERPDPLAAAASIDIVNKIYGLSVDYSELVKDAERIEQEVRELLEKRAVERGRETQAYI